MRSLCLFDIICLLRPTFPNQLSDNIIVKEVKKSIDSSNLSFNSKKTQTRTKQNFQEAQDTRKSPIEQKRPVIQKKNFGTSVLSWQPATMKP